MGRSPVKLQIEWVWRGGSTGDEEAMMAGAFDGIRIIDLTTMVSRPMACMMLADQGAEVIKIEAPTGDQVVRALEAEGVLAHRAPDT